MGEWRFRPCFWVTTALKCVASLVDIFIILRWNVKIGIPDKVCFASNVAGVSWWGMVPRGVAWHGVLQHGMVWCGVVWCAKGAVTKRQ